MPIVPVRPPVAPTVLPEWEERTMVFRYSSGAVYTCDCWQYGTLACHPTLPDELHQLVAVTHVPSKLAVVRVREVDDAVAIAERLWETCRDAWIRDEVDKTRIPADILKWITDCNLQRRKV